MNIEVIKANYLNTKHEKEIQELLNIYASDPKTGVALFWQKMIIEDKLF